MNRKRLNVDAAGHSNSICVYMNIIISCEQNLPAVYQKLPLCPRLGCKQFRNE